MEDWEKAQLSMLDTAYPVKSGVRYQEEVPNELMSILRRTGDYGKSGCVVVYGPPGSGKRTLIFQCLREFRHRCPHQDNSLTKAEYDGCFHRELTEVPELVKQSPCCLLFLTHFEEFCSPSRQIFLYNLIEELEARRRCGVKCMLIIAMTSRCDFLDKLEKRIRSRFSHQLLHVRPPSYEEYRKLAESMLNPSGCSPEWKEKVEELLQEDGPVDRILRSQYDLSPDLNCLRRLLHLPAVTLSKEKPELSVDAFLESSRMCSTDPVCHQLESLTSVELIVLISAMQHFPRTFNFEMVLVKYRQFTANRKNLAYERSFIKKAYENLVSLGLIVPERGVNFVSDRTTCSLTVTRLQVRQMLSQYRDCPYDLMSWLVQSDYD